MLWPMSLPTGKILLLSPPQSFNASYIRGTLQLCGAPLLVAVVASDGQIESITDEELASVIGCVAVDLSPDIGEDLERRHPAFPWLFVTSLFGVPVPDVERWIYAPFASYQVIERLVGLVSAVGRSNAKTNLI